MWKKIEVQSFRHLAQIFIGAERNNLRVVSVWRAGRDALKVHPSYVEFHEPDPKYDPPRHIRLIRHKQALKQRLSPEEQKMLDEYSAAHRPC